MNTSSAEPYSNYCNGDWLLPWCRSFWGPCLATLRTVFSRQGLWSSWKRGQHSSCQVGVTKHGCVGVSGMPG